MKNLFIGENKRETVRQNGVSPISNRANSNASTKSPNGEFEGNETDSRFANGFQSVASNALFEQFPRQNYQLFENKPITISPLNAVVSAQSYFSPIAAREKSPPTFDFAKTRAAVCEFERETRIWQRNLLGQRNKSKEFRAFIPRTIASKKLPFGVQRRRRASTRSSLSTALCTPTQPIAVRRCSASQSDGDLPFERAQTFAPRLTRKGYFCAPSPAQLGRLDARRLRTVDGFRVWNEYGCIEWLEPVDLLGADLDRLVHISWRCAEVYPEKLISADEKPPIGAQINVRARITLCKIACKLPKRRLLANVAAMCKRQNAEFVSYDSANRQITFEVPHFTKYSFLDIEETDNSAGEKPIEARDEIYNEMGDAEEEIVRPLRVKRSEPFEEIEHSLAEEPSSPPNEPNARQLDEHVRRQLDRRKRELESSYAEYQTWEAEPLPQCPADPSNALFAALAGLRAALAGQAPNGSALCQDFAFGLQWRESESVAFVRAGRVANQNVRRGEPLSTIVAAALNDALLVAFAAESPDPVYAFSRDGFLFALHHFELQLAQRRPKGAARDLLYLIALLNALFGAAMPSNSFSAFRRAIAAEPQSEHVSDARRRRALFVCLERWISEGERVPTAVREFQNRARRSPQLSTAELVAGFAAPSADALGAAFAAAIALRGDETIRFSFGESSAEIRLFAFLLFALSERLPRAETLRLRSAALSRALGASLADLLAAERPATAALLCWAVLPRTAATARSAQLVARAYAQLVARAYAQPNKGEIGKETRRVLKALLGADRMSELRLAQRLRRGELFKAVSRLVRTARATEAGALLAARAREAFDPFAVDADAESALAEAVEAFRATGERQTVVEALAGVLRLSEATRTAKLSAESCARFVGQTLRAISASETDGELLNCAQRRTLELVSWKLICIVSAASFPFAEYVRGEFAEKVSNGEFRLLLSSEQLLPAIERLYRKLYFN